MSPTPVARRTIVCGLAALVPAALAACTVDTQPGTAPVPSSGAAAPAPPTTTAPPPSSSAATTSSAPVAGIAALSSVPVGGGTLVEGPDGPLVLVQPTAGTVAAFSAVCPHQGVIVQAPADGVIFCPGHGSRFAADTGAVQNGPAVVGLTAVPVRVAGDQVVLA